MMTPTAGFALFQPKRRCDCNIRQPNAERSRHTPSMNPRRVMSTAMATDQAAGVAAALSTASVTDLAARIRGELVRQRAILSL